jgi:N-acetyl-anhydromuramyl-L-alanine amidase AmpD
VYRFALIALSFYFASARVLGSQASADPGAVPYPDNIQWIQAANGTHDIGREGQSIRYIVIHDTEVSEAKTISTFLSPVSRVSAHYVVSGRGHITQMVPESDTAWHAGNYWINETSIGIEHELDRVTNPAFTAAQYQASAKLVCAIASRYGVPIDRAHIIGHNEVPGANHTDPGPTWNWPYYMWLVSLCADPRQIPAAFKASWAQQSDPEPTDVGATTTVTVWLKNTGSVPWVKGTDKEMRLGTVGMSDGAALVPVRVAQSQTRVEPGAIGSFIVPITVAAAGTHRVRLRAVLDGVSWMPDQGIYIEVHALDDAEVHAVNVAKAFLVP